MKSLLIYTTKHGTTQKIVDKLVKKLKGEYDIVNVLNKFAPDLSSYDRVIIGGSIYAGSVSIKLKKFLKNNLEELLKKDVALFLVCMQEGEDAKREFEENFPKKLRDKSRVNGFFGGEIIISKLNIFEKVVVRIVSKTKCDVEKINEKEIEVFTRKLNKK